ncbi:MAG: FAD-dependent monooxygenase [Actinomycetota bacterium]
MYTTPTDPQQRNVLFEAPGLLTTGAVPIDAIAPRLRHYDVVIVGARAAGAATAMLLAQSGLRVLVVDRQGYGSDTLSTHALMRGAVRRLARWDLLDQVWASNTPAITAVTFSYGGADHTVEITPDPVVEALAAPRRTALDPILVDAARSAGAEVLHRTALVEVPITSGGRVHGAQLRLADGSAQMVTCDVLVGADGLRSLVGRLVGATVTRRAAHTSAVTFGYYRGLDVDHHRFQWLYDHDTTSGNRIAGGVIPTTDDTTCVFAATEPDRFTSEARADVAGFHQRIIDSLDPELGAQVSGAERVGALRSWPGVLGRFLKPYGPGWALVGDAGYFKDPAAAHGITDAFRDAELLALAIVSGDMPGYEERRDALSLPLFEVLDRMASFQWDLAELGELHLQLAAAMKAEDDTPVPALV